MIKNNLSIKIGGQAGFGINATGEIFAKACVRAGLWTFGYIEYPSLIRGGHNSYQIIVSEKDVQAPRKDLNLLVALDELTINNHIDELSKDAGIVCDGEEIDVDSLEIKRGDLNLYPIPLLKLTIEAGGQKMMTNMTALGATVGLLDFDLMVLEEVIKEQFQGKEEKIAEINISCAKAGYRFVKDRFKTDFGWGLEPVEGEKKMILTGNEATAIGALAGGLQFFVAFPMTPSTSILHYLIGKEEESGIVVKQMEDEIAVINMGIGASYAGARTMMATSGGGFSLMVEGLGLAAMTETPIVVVDSQRGGPSTGMPTWTEQGDLQFLLKAGQGDFPRIVLAPGDVEECYTIAAQALNLAEKYQVPVLILLDKFLSESDKSQPFFADKITIDRGKIATDTHLKKSKEFLRYQDSTDGVSARSLPGQINGEYIANSDEHDFYGYSTDDIKMRQLMAEKRHRKSKVIAAEINGLKVFGPSQAQVSIIGWGSTKGPALESLEILSKAGVKAKYLHLSCLDPLPIKALQKETAGKHLFLIEGNQTGQLGELLQEKAGIKAEHQYLKYNGRPFFPEDIVEHVLDGLNKSPLSGRVWF